MPLTPEEQARANQAYMLATGKSMEPQQQPTPAASDAPIFWNGQTPEADPIAQAQIEAIQKRNAIRQQMRDEAKARTAKPDPSVFQGMNPVEKAGYEIGWYGGNAPGTKGTDKAAQPARNRGNIQIKFADLDLATAELDAVEKAIKDNTGSFGVIKGKFLGANPWNVDLGNLQARTRTLAGMMYPIVHGTGGDEKARNAYYSEAAPKIGEPVEKALGKLAQFRLLINAKRNGLLRQNEINNQMVPQSSYADHTDDAMMDNAEGAADDGEFMDMPAQ